MEDDRPRPGQNRLRAVLRLALPSAGELLLGTLVGIVNTYLVGHLGASQLAAVGLSFQVVMVGMVGFSAAGTGATALISRMVGAGDWQAANRVLWQALMVAVAIGLLFTVPLELLAERALLLVGAEEQTLALGVPFMRIYCSVYVFSAVMYIGNACMRGAGDARTPLLIMVAVNLVNIAVAWTLIDGLFGLPAMGVNGAAIGAMVGRLIGGLMVIALLLKGRAGLKLEWSQRRPDMDIIRRLIRIGLPVSFEQLVFRFGMLIYVRQVAALGTVAYAAHQVALNAESISYMPGFGFAMAATTLVGQGLGAKDPERGQRDVYTACYLSAGLMSVMGVFFFLFPEHLMSFFTSDPEVVAQGIEPLRLIGLVQPFLAVMMVFGGALRGAGDTVTPMWVNGVGVWVLRLPLTLLFTGVWQWGLLGAWIAMSLDLVIRGIVLFARFRLGHWKAIKV